MSNTATVTPYAENSTSTTGALGAAAGVVITGGVALAKFLWTETEQDRAANAHYQQQRRDEMLLSCRPTQLSVVGNDLQGMIAAAKTLGYSIVGDAGASLTCMRDSTGHRIAMEARADRLELFGNADVTKLQSIVRERTVSAAMSHLNKLSGNHAQIRRGSDGSLELQAHESAAAGRVGGPARITAQISKEGAVTLDIENVKGNRCEKVLADFASAVGGSVKNKKIKSFYYQQLPGEPTTIKL